MKAIGWAALIRAGVAAVGVTVPVAVWSDAYAQQHAPAGSAHALAEDVARLRLDPTGAIGAYDVALRREIARAAAASGSARAVNTDAAFAAGRAEAVLQLRKVFAGPAATAGAIVLERRYSVADLRALRDFYATDTGRRLAGTWPPSGDPHDAQRAQAAANSPAGKAFLHSPLGIRENHDGFAQFERAVADAVNAAMPEVNRAVMQRVTDAVRSPAAGLAR